MDTDALRSDDLVRRRPPDVSSFLICSKKLESGGYASAWRFILQFRSTCMCEINHTFEDCPRKRHQEATADVGLPSAQNVISNIQEFPNMDFIDRNFLENRKKRSLKWFFSMSSVSSEERAIFQSSSPSVWTKEAQHRSTFCPWTTVIHTTTDVFFRCVYNSHVSSCPLAQSGAGTELVWNKSKTTNSQTTPNCLDSVCGKLTTDPEGLCASPIQLTQWTFNTWSIFIWIKYTFIADNNSKQCVVAL